MLSYKIFAFYCALLSSITEAGPTTSRYAIARRDGVPDCDNDSQTYSGPYTDGQGTYVTSDGVTHPYKFPKVRKCWWDYFIVEASAELLPWQKGSGDIYCTGTERCVVQQLTGSQVCQEHSTSISAEVGLKIEDITLGVSVEVTDSESKCVVAQDATQCSWNDAQCHTVWTQQQVLKQTGYRRHRCNWGNGDETECMADWQQTTPTDMINYGCDSQCSDTNTCGNTDGQPCS